MRPLEVADRMITELQAERDDLKRRVEELEAALDRNSSFNVAVTVAQLQLDNAELCRRLAGLQVPDEVLAWRAVVDTWRTKGAGWAEVNFEIFHQLQVLREKRESTTPPSEGQET